MNRLQKTYASVYIAIFTGITPVWGIAFAGRIRSTIQQLRSIYATRLARPAKLTASGVMTVAAMKAITSNESAKTPSNNSAQTTDTSIQATKTNTHYVPLVFLNDNGHIHQPIKRPDAHDAFDVASAAFNIMLGESSGWHQVCGIYTAEGTVSSEKLPWWNFWSDGLKPEISAHFIEAPAYSKTFSSKSTKVSDLALPLQELAKNTYDSTVQEVRCQKSSYLPDRLQRELQYRAPVSDEDFNATLNSFNASKRQETVVFVDKGIRAIAHDKALMQKLGLQAHPCDTQKNSA